ncbi:terminal oxidase subunit II [Salmonella bongori]|nr:terminal oxidase subunit II [Salmonella bongori]
MTIDLPVIWFAIIVFATLMYIVMDGFDLGVGILFPFIRDKTRSRCHGELGRAGMGWQRNLAWSWGALACSAHSRWPMLLSRMR